MEEGFNTSPCIIPKEFPNQVKGRFIKGNSGNPLGRPKGSPNKFSKIKQQLLEVWEKGTKKQKLLKYVTKDERTFYLFTKELILPLLQKEDTSKSTGNTTNIYTVVNFD